MVETPAQIDVEVVYATPEKQVLLTQKLNPGATAHEAILNSGILELFPEIKLAESKIGIFSQVCTLEYTLQHKDRVEIYRPLLHDPKDARRLRAGKK